MYMTNQFYVTRNTVQKGLTKSAFCFIGDSNFIMRTFYAKTFESRGSVDCRITDAITPSLLVIRILLLVRRYLCQYFLSSIAEIT